MRKELGWKPFEEARAIAVIRERWRSWKEDLCTTKWNSNNNFYPKQAKQKENKNNNKVTKKKNETKQGKN